MIYTVTFNPAIDYVIKVKDLTLGMVNRTTREDVYCGGKGINVSNVLSNLGIDSVGLGFIAGFTGDAIEAGAKELGFHPDFIRLREGMTRINVKIKSNEESEINGQGPVIHEDELDQMFRKLDQLKDGDMLVLAGSIPASLPEDIYEKIMERLQKKDIQIVVDATKDLLLNVLKYHPFLIKPNNHELGEMFGIVLEGNDQIIEYAKKLQEKGARNVLVSMAGDGAVLVSADGRVLRPCRQRARSSIPWAPGIPWWQVFWPAIWRRAITREPFTWASAPEALRLFPRDWRRRRTCTRCSRR